MAKDHPEATDKLATLTVPSFSREKELQRIQQIRQDLHVAIMIQTKSKVLLTRENERKRLTHILSVLGKIPPRDYHRPEEPTKH